jgi:TetR/AcrR family transcriptional regulator of autoinduction and epiphytic fitness
MARATEEEVADGRTLRRLRNEQKAVDAFLELLNEGHGRPTAQQVAERSGVSLRSIFRLFDDVDTLNAAAIAQQSERIAQLQPQIPATGPVAGRIDAVVDQMATVYETIANVRRFAVHIAVTSPAIAKGIGRHGRLTRLQVRATFAPELAALPATDRTEVGDALAAATSWETWDGLRAGQRQSVTAAKRVVRRLIAGLIA